MSLNANDLQLGKELQLFEWIKKIERILHLWEIQYQLST